MSIESDGRPELELGIPGHEPLAETLTSRELEILNLIFSGRASSEVASLLCVSKRTVDFHLGKAYAKLGVSNRVQAYRRATELGLIS